MDELSDKFYYLYSSDVPARIQIKIGTLEGKRNKPTYEELLKDPHLKFSGVCQDGCSDLMVECQIWDNNEPLCLPVGTEYKAFTTRWNWNEWLHMPLEFCDLPRTAQLAISVYDCAGPDKLIPVGGTTVSLFSKHGVFREGMLDLRVWPNVVADGKTPTTTPGKGQDGKEHSTDQMWKLAKLAKKHRNGHIPKVDWLDRLTFRKLEVINDKEKRSSEYMYLTVEFQKVFSDGIQHHVVYFEQNGEEIHTFKANADLVFVPDPEIGKEEQCIYGYLIKSNNGRSKHVLLAAISLFHAHNAMSKTHSLWDAVTMKLSAQKTKDQTNNKTILCQLCEHVIKSSTVKCANCNRYLHKRCMERACMLFDVSETDWKCRDCANLSPAKFELSLVKKENESLKQQVAVLTKLVSEQDLVNCLQREKIEQYLGNNENLVERKHHMLARSLRSGHNDKDAKPNAAVRDILNQIVSYPPTKQLSNEEQDYVWKFRFYLSTQKKALAKFLKCVNWRHHNEVRQALHLIGIWVPMDVEDALDLLSPNFSHPAVRRYAINRLQQAPDDEILLYLLQLVQALKYENFSAIQEGYERIASGQEVFPFNEDSGNNCLEKKDSKDSNCTITAESVLQRSSSYNQADHLASSTVNSVVEVETARAQQPSQSLPPSIMQNICTESGNTDTLQSNMYEEEEDVKDLASFLIYRACKNFTLANYFYWYLLLECEDQEGTIKQDEEVRNMYLTVMKTFSRALAKGTESMQKKRTILAKQQKFIDKLVQLIKAVSRENAYRTKKIQKLKELLSDPDGFKYNFAKFDPIPFPLDPEITISGIVAEKALLFKSALMPAKLHFLTTDEKEYVAIFKLGDDLRQDQLILQMITLMDKLLNKENLDLKLTPYRVLATSTKHGFVQFIESTTVAEVLGMEGSIQNYFRKNYPQENVPYGIQPDIMDAYVRSCAGYCVITYLLGVGDRHLDNLLLTKDGRLFHIDFGYILGRDPKPLPPPMKLSKEMVDAMGGVNSEHYQEFRKLCYTAFLHLRRHANLMLNLFSLMVDASVPDIALEPDKAVKKVQDKLMLDLGEEEAVHYIQNLIDTSVSAVMPAIVEQLHKITQYIRK